MVMGVFKLSENVFWMDDSILDPFQVKKKKRIDSIKNMLAELKEVELKAFIAKISVDCGINGATARAYLEDLETAGYIQVKNGIIIWKETDLTSQNQNS
jgi:predicted transcriptional regulator